MIDPDPGSSLAGITATLARLRATLGLNPDGTPTTALVAEQEARLAAEADLQRQITAEVRRAQLAEAALVTPQQLAEVAGSVPDQSAAVASLQQQISDLANSSSGSAASLQKQLTAEVTRAKAAEAATPFVLYSQPNGSTALVGRVLLNTATGVLTYFDGNNNAVTGYFLTASGLAALAQNLPTTAPDGGGVWIDNGVLRVS